MKFIIILEDNSKYLVFISFFFDIKLV